MSLRGFILAFGLSLAACGHGGESRGLYYFEIDYLAEDTIDLMTIVFQAGENAFAGDPVAPADVVDPAGPGNGFTVDYDLPEAPRAGLGFGSGRALYRVVEDGIPNATPLAFSTGTTDALTVVIEYDLFYEGETPAGRLTEVDLAVTVTLTRTGPADPFVAEYFIAGVCWLGPTYCEITTDFRAAGRPRDGIELASGDGAGFIDDPDVFDVFDLDVDYTDVGFNAEGHVGCCGVFFEEFFLYSEVF